MTGCPCVCHGNGAYPPPCDIPGGCHTHHEPTRRCVRGHRCAARVLEQDEWLGAPTDRPLCPVDETRVREALEDVPSLWTALSKAVRVKAVGAQGERVSGSSPASQRSPLNLGAQTLLDDVHGLLTRWEEVVRDVARLTPPRDDLGPEDSASAAASTLATHLAAWLAAEAHEFNLDRDTTVTETGPDAAGALLDWRATARALPGVDPQAPKAVRRYAWFPCPACGVKALTHRAGDPLIHCQNCGATQPFEDDERKLAVWIRETTDLPPVDEPPHRGPGSAVTGHDAHTGAAAHTLKEGAA